MLPEISLSILDIVHNSIKAEASSIRIHISIQESNDLLSLIIEDNGIGMSESTLEKVVNPFYTTRTTRRVGLGVPFIKEQTEITGGSFHITSTQSLGTKIRCNYILSSINRMPLGNITSTIHSLVIGYEHIHFVFSYKVNDHVFVLDTKELRDIVGDISFGHYQISSYINDYIFEHITELNQGKIY